MSRGAAWPLSVVIDTNVWFSGIVTGGVPEAVIFELIEHHAVYCSHDIIEELATALRASTNASHKFIKYARDALENVVHTIDIGPVPQVARDPKDNHVIALALSSKASLVITGDADLLTLGSYEHILFITPKEAQDLLGL